MDKPITIARREYIKNICDITNKSGLPSFVVVDVLEKILASARENAENELKRDEAMWRKFMSEVNDDGGQEDK